MLTVQKKLEPFQKFAIKLKVLPSSNLSFPVQNFKDGEGGKGGGGSKEKKDEHQTQENNSLASNVVRHC